MSFILYVEIKIVSNAVMLFFNIKSLIFLDGGKGVKVNIA